MGAYVHHIDLVPPIGGPPHFSESLAWLLARVFSSLRFRLLLLTTRAMVPAFTIVLYDNALQRQQATEDGHRSANRLASLTAITAKDQITATRELLRVLTQLAIEAMEGGGEVTLLGRRDGEAILIEVSDTGPGIPTERLSRIWDTFYTTKAEGTGLGLEIVKSLVESRPGATIEVDSTPGRRGGRGAVEPSALSRQWRSGERAKGGP